MSVNPQSPNRSPSLLAPPPKRAPGVRRLNHVPLYAAGAASLAIIGVVAYTAIQRSHNQVQVASEEQSRPHAGKPIDLPPGDVEPAAYRTVAPSPKPQPQNQAAAASMPSDQPRQDEDEATKARREAWRAYYQQVAEVQKAKLEMAQKALSAPTSANVQQGANAVPAGAAGPGDPFALVPVTPGTAGLTPSLSVGYGLAGYLPPAGPDPSGAREKQAFMSQPGSLGQDDTLPTRVHDPISPYLVTAGDVIPCEAVTGANSGTPGQFVGRVTTTVYDSATGTIPLIPQGSKVVGSYDNVVTAGQDRIPTILTRIIFPDTSSISIGAMPGADQAGFAGLHDRVNRHLWEKFGNAVILAAASAGIQLSQPAGSPYGQYSSQQIAAGALGQQTAQLGQEFARAGLSVPNTITVRNGYPFVIQVTRDLVLRPWVDRRTVQPISLGPVQQ